MGLPTPSEDPIGHGRAMGKLVKDIARSCCETEEEYQQVIAKIKIDTFEEMVPPESDSNSFNAVDAVLLLGLLGVLGWLISGLYVLTHQLSVAWFPLPYSRYIGWPLFFFFVWCVYKRDFPKKEEKIYDHEETKRLMKRLNLW